MCPHTFKAREEYKSHFQRDHCRGSDAAVDAGMVLLKCISVCDSALPLHNFVGILTSRVLPNVLKAETASITLLLLSLIS